MTLPSKVQIVFSTLVACCVACQLEGTGVDLERMIRQRKCVPYSTCRWLPENRTMRRAPEGTVPRDQVLGNPALTQGTSQGRPIDFIPLDIDLATMRRGASRFEIFCAACHGILGDGNTEVAKNMHLRKPPSLHTSDIVAYPPGRLFQIISKGYGLMPAYDVELSVEDRWALVAYIQALQLSQQFVLHEQSEETRSAVLEVLR